MYKGASNIRKPLGWASSLALSLAVVGCGGESPAPKSVADPTPKPPSADVKAPAKTKGKGGALSEGGDIGVAERRAQKQKERAAAGK
jgi:hypothetical protein